MKIYRYFIVLGVWLGMCIFSIQLANGADFTAMDSYHTDRRQTPKLIFSPDFDPKTRKSGEDLAYEYLYENHEKFGLPENLRNLRLSHVKKSLLGDHYHFQQNIHDVEVEKAEIIVSVNRKDGRILKVFNNTYPQTHEMPVPKGMLQEDTAMEIAWNHLRVHGKLLSMQTAKLEYAPENNGFRLIYKMQTNTQAPFGYWEHRIDAYTGDILTVRKTQIDAKTEEKPYDFTSYEGPILSREKEIARFLKKEAEKELKDMAIRASANGTAQVFDPDPRTTLMDDTIEDTDPPSVFTAAYQTRTLQDITETSGIYSLEGPWVEIADFESPTQAPSTTTTGNWTALRGDNAFNDAMTYFHIDQNQRYVQSLGYTGATGIQEGPIEADSDGAEGQDQSYYYTSTNQLSFGHGCVDDNEDADVILHEYFHALHHDINANWEGGDTGAMGEGFADNWAASYSYSTPNGPNFHPEWAFSWDGHNNCWDGRVMNRLAAQYDPSETYDDHEMINGVNGDELWGTPLFQAFLELIDQGYPRTDMDKILLESNFGLGANLKMPDMANAIVTTAAALFPQGNHSDVYLNMFVNHNILRYIFPGMVSVTDPGSNGVADPGETVQLTIPIFSPYYNITGVSAVLSSSTDGVTVDQGNSNYPNIPAGGTRNNLTAFSVYIPDSHICGVPVNLQMQVTYTSSSQQTEVFIFSLETGVNNQVTVSPGTSIPDDDPTGITSQITFSGTGENVTFLSVDMNITHSWIGDLIITLRSPNNTTVTLHDRSGDSTDDILGSYPNTLTPEESLDAFMGEPLDGTWTLTISDNAGADTGTLNSWGIVNHLAASNSTATSIPDNDSMGITSEIIFSSTGENVTSLSVDMNITHTYIGDLIITLRSPSNTSVTLHDRSGGSTDDIIGTYPNTLTPEESLDAFFGEPLDGTWTLTVSDNAEIDSGTLNSWTITNAALVCEASDDDSDDDGMPDDWEQAHGLNPAFDDAYLDPDGDFFCNLEEYYGGTHPNNSADGEMTLYSYNYYFPYFLTGSEYWYGVGLRNSSLSQNADVLVVAYDQGGNVNRLETNILPARGQQAWVVGVGLEGEGWVRVRSDQPLTGLCFFGEADTITYMADITLIHTLSQTLDVPHVAQDSEWDTAILVSNPNGSSTTVTLTFVDGQGNALYTDTHVIAANGSGRYELSDLVEGIDYPNGSVEITATQGIAAFALYNNLKWGAYCFAGISAVDPSVVPPLVVTYNYYFPYFISGSEYWYGVGLRNSSDSQDANVSVNVYDQGGNVVRTENTTLPARGQKAWVVGSGLAGEGWVRISSDQPLTGLCFFGEADNITYMADITLIHTLSQTLDVPHVAQNSEWDTAILVSNPNGSSTTITLTFVNGQGNALYTDTHVIPGNGSRRYELSDLVEGVDYPNGSVEIDASQGVAAFALYNNLKWGDYCFSGISAVDPNE